METDTVSPRTNIKGISFEELKEMDTNTLVDLLTPLIMKHSRKAFIYGYDLEDKRQEISIVVWNCQKKFRDDKTGANGRPSSFINYVIHAITNRLGHLDYAGKKQMLAVTGRKCLNCENVVPVAAKQKCDKCGGRRWQSIRDARVGSIDVITAGPTGWQPGDTDDYDFEDKDLIISVLKGIPQEMHGAAIAGIEEGKLDPRLQQMLREHILANQGILTRTPVMAVPRKGAKTKVRIHSDAEDLPTRA